MKRLSVDFGDQTLQEQGLVESLLLEGIVEELGAQRRLHVGGDGNPMKAASLSVL
jgi:hypothetical protein